MTSINPGIVETVRRLNAAGWKTCDSGDGETHEFECDRDHSYVVIKLDASTCDLVDDTDKVVALLNSWGLEVVSEASMYAHNPAFHGLGFIEPVPGTDVSKWVVVDSVYSPADGVAVIDIRYIHDNMLGQEEWRD